MDSKSKILDDVARLVGDVVDVAHNVKEEFDGILKSKAEQLTNHLELVSSEQFEIVRELTTNNSMQLAELMQRVKTLEAKLELLVGDDKALLKATNIPPVETVNLQLPHKK